MDVMKLMAAKSLKKRQSAPSDFTGFSWLRITDRKFFFTVALGEGVITFLKEATGTT